MAGEKVRVCKDGSLWRVSYRNAISGVYTTAAYLSWDRAMARATIQARLARLAAEVGW